MTNQSIQSVGEFEYGLEVSREVFGFEIEFHIPDGDVKISFPRVNGVFAGFNEVVEQPSGMKFEFGVRDSNVPSHIPDNTWGMSISDSPNDAGLPLLTTGYIYKYLISVEIQKVGNAKTERELIDEAKLVFSRVIDWFEILSEQDVSNGSAPISRGKVTMIWGGSAALGSPPAIDANCSARIVIEGRALTLDNLKQAVEFHKLEREPDPSSILLRDSRRAFHKQYFRESFLLSGVAAEIKMVRYLLKEIDLGKNVGISAYKLQNSAGLGEIFSYWKSTTGDELIGNVTLNSKLRNDVAHRGVFASLEQALDFYLECATIILKTEELN